MWMLPMGRSVAALLPQMQMCVLCVVFSTVFVFIEWTSVGRNVVADWGQLIGNVWGSR